MSTANRASLILNSPSTHTLRTLNLPDTPNAWPTLDPLSVAAHARQFNDTYTPAPPTLRAEPSRRFIWVVHHLAHKLTHTLEVGDIRGKKGGEGASYFLSLVMDRITLENTHLGEQQLSLIARHAAFCHPVILARCLRSDGERRSVITRGLQHPSAGSDGTLLCPMDTPYLITDTRLRERAEDPSKLTKKDLLNAIVPFVNCCYPRTADKLKRKFETFSTERLAILFDTAGAFHKFAQTLSTTCSLVST